MSYDQMEALRQEGLEKLRNNEPACAIELFDAAMAASTDSVTLQRLLIHKTMGLLALERLDAPELSELPKIVFRRADETNVYLAAYALSYRFRLESKLERAAHYANIALEAATNLNQPDWILDSLTELGNVAVYDSRFGDAIERYEQAIALLPEDSNQFRRFFLLQNIGYSRIVSGDAEEGVTLIEEAVALMQKLGTTGYLAESYIDLCHGYLELGNLDQAKYFGDLGLVHLVDSRQERNIHYLLGEIAYKTGDFSAAELHFDHLATHYPDFPQLKNLLLAVDLRRMINWKLS